MISYYLCVWFLTICSSIYILCIVMCVCYIRRSGEGCWILCIWAWQLSMLCCQFLISCHFFSCRFTINLLFITDSFIIKCSYTCYIYYIKCVPFDLMSLVGHSILNWFERPAQQIKASLNYLSFLLYCCVHLIIILILIIIYYQL